MFGNVLSEKKLSPNLNVLNGGGELSALLLVGGVLKGGARVRRGRATGVAPWGVEEGERCLAAC